MANAPSPTTIFSIPDRDPDADELPFTPQTLEHLGGKVEELYHHALFEVDTAGADVMAEQHYLIALSLIQQAERHFKLAQYAQSQGIVAMQGFK